MPTLSPQQTGAGRTGGSLYRPAQTPTLTIREAVAAWLRGLSALTAIVGTRIYKQDPSQLSSYPCVVIEQPSREYGRNLAGADGTSLADVQITALALKESQAVAIAEAVRNSWQCFRGTQSGVAILWAYLDDEADGSTAPPDGSDQWIYQNAVIYRIKHRVPLPTFVTQTNV